MAGLPAEVQTLRFQTASCPEQQCSSLRRQLVDQRQQQQQRWMQKVCVDFEFLPWSVVAPASLLGTVPAAMFVAVIPHVLLCNVVNISTAYVTTAPVIKEGKIQKKNKTCELYMSQEEEEEKKRRRRRRRRQMKDAHTEGMHCEHLAAEGHASPAVHACRLSHEWRWVKPVKLIKPAATASHLFRTHGKDI